jgi:CubicO group peptidase (beta-lactamase class C family)
MATAMAELADSLGLARTGLPHAKGRAWIVAFCAFALTGTTDKPLAPAATDRALETFFAAGDLRPPINGAVAVSADNMETYRGAFGFSDFASQAPVTLDAVFQTASLAKPFTATAILQLRDAGRINLDAPVQRYFADFPFPEITVRHLLNHTSGLPDLELYEDMVATDANRIIRSSDIIAALRHWKQPLPSVPGGKFRYSNTNYQLLAYLVERVSGKRFGAYLRERIFRPAGMRSSYVLGDPALGPTTAPVTNHIFAAMFKTSPEDVRRVTFGSARKMRRLRYETVNLGSTVGDQNLFTTVKDLMRFDEALRAGRILSMASQIEAYAPTRLNDGSFYESERVDAMYGVRCSYGLGWETCNHPGRGRIVGHSGYNHGIATVLYRALESKKTVALFDNGDSGEFGSKVASIVNIINGEQPAPFIRQKPLTRLYGALLLSEGPTSALLSFNRHRVDTAHWISTPEGINQLGYDLLTARRPDLAVEAFHLNIILNPADAAYYDSWGEGLAAAGRKQEAIAAYRRSLELDPDNPSGRRALAQLEAD